MRRRRILAVTLPLVAPASGCLDRQGSAADGADSDGNGSPEENGSPDEGAETATPTEQPPGTDRDPETFEECGSLVIRRHQLPEPAREEVDVALTEGGYETTGKPYLPHLFDVHASFLRADGDHYRVSVDRGDVTRIELEETVPTRGMQSFAVANGGPGTVEAAIHIERRRDGAVVVDETVIVDPGTETAAGSAFDRPFGRYVATVETESVTETVRWREREDAYPLRGVVIYDDEVAPKPRAVLEPVHCPTVWCLD